MNFIIRTVAALLLCGAASLAAAEPAFHGDAADARKVWNTFEGWLGAYENGDLKSTMSIFDKDVIFAFQGAKDQGYAELERGYQADFASRAPGTVWVPVIDEVYADGGLAFVRSFWELRVKSANGGVEVKERNRSIDVLRRSAEGWKIVRSLNYPEQRQRG
jgi:ketosteroid isomerase-like protein